MSIKIEKSAFVEEMRRRTKQLAIDTILICKNLEKCKASDVVSYQLIKAATSTGANYRAACKARSKREFFSKICIVNEEIDETIYWFEIVEEASLLPNSQKLKQLSSEAQELAKIISKAKDSCYQQN